VKQRVAPGRSAADLTPSRRTQTLSQNALEHAIALGA
jgi:hypothetical protein